MLTCDSPDETRDSKFLSLRTTFRIQPQRTQASPAISHTALNNSISTKESKGIRHEWDELKRLTERFAKWCEVGDFVHLAEDLKVNRSSGSKT